MGKFRQMNTRVSALYLCLKLVSVPHGHVSANPHQALYTS